MIKPEQGIFCEVYGDTMENRVLEYLLENQSQDIAIGNMLKEVRISKPKAYQIIRKFEKKGYVKKSRIIGKTQLYALNKKNEHVKIFWRNFMECLNMVIDEYSEKKPMTNGSSAVGMTYARHT